MSKFVDPGLIDPIGRPQEKYRIVPLSPASPLPACVWDRVEYYDKVEQAASITWLGLPETVHAELWAKVPIALQEAAVAVTRYVYDRFPPKEQLDPTSKLAYEFLRLHDVYKTQAGF